MEIYTAGLVQQLSPLDKPYARPRSDEDIFYAANAGSHPWAWFGKAFAALRAPRRRPAATKATPIHLAQMA